jgi:hypothetical protein
VAVAGSPTAGSATVCHDVRDIYMRMIVLKKGAHQGTAVWKRPESMIHAFGNDPQNILDMQA